MSSGDDIRAKAEGASSLPPSGEPIEIRWQGGTIQQGTVVSENGVHGYADIAVEDGVVRVLQSDAVGEGWITPSRFHYFFSEDA